MTKKMSNSALLLTAPVAAHSVVPPLCLPPSAAAERNVVQARRGSEATNVNTKR